MPPKPSGPAGPRIAPPDDTVRLPPPPSPWPGPRREGETGLWPAARLPAPRRRRRTGPWLIGLGLLGGLGLAGAALVGLPGRHDGAPRPAGQAMAPAAPAPAAPAPEAQPPQAAPAAPPATAPAPATPAPPAALPEPPPPILTLPLEQGGPLRPPAVLPDIPLLDEAGIAAHRATAPRLLRLAENPRIFVLDFPDLASQGAALNRIAALVEKAGAPRDRVLAEAELRALLARTGQRAESYYYGHDYRGSDVARFLALAARDGVPLNPGEQWVAEQYALARRAEPVGEIALLSIVAPGGPVDMAARRTTLRHEIGHGHDFTLPFYAAHVRRVWQEQLVEAERDAFRRFLGREGYDTRNDDLMASEMQAYLLFTPDRRFFRAGLLGLGEAQLENLRETLRAGAFFEGLPLAAAPEAAAR